MQRFSRRLAIPIFIVLGVLQSEKTAAQNTDAKAYFPLHEGNTWSFYEILEPPFSPPDTLFTGTSSVRGRVDIAGIIYSRFRWPNGVIDTLRTDEAGHVWKYGISGDVLALDFSRNDGDVYTIRKAFFGSDTLDVQVSITKGLSVDAIAGSFDNCIGIALNALYVMDVAYSYTFAPNVGMVRYGGAWDSGRLYSAVVDGAIISNVETSPRNDRDQLEVESFPNPFSAKIQIRVSLHTPGRLLLQLFDGLGRAVKRIMRDHLPSGEYSFAVDTSELPTGVYYLKSSTSSTHLTRAIVHI